MRIQYGHTTHSQSGAVLVVCLILLLILTLLSVSSARSTLMQEKMTAAAMDSHLALQSAELGIDAAETYINTLTSTASFTTAGTGGLYKKNSAPGNAFATATWSDSTKVRTAINSPVTGVNGAKYLIEEIGVLDESAGAADINVTGYGQSTGAGTVTGFRVVSQGLGRSTDTERVVVSYYGKRL